MNSIETVVVALSADVDCLGNPTPKVTKLPRKQAEPKHHPIGYIHKNLESRKQIKILSKAKNLHFVSAKALLTSLENREYTVDYFPTQTYGFYPPLFTNLDGETFEMVTLNLHFHRFNTLSVDEYGKTNGSLIPFEVESNHIDYNYIVESQKDEEAAVLAVQQILTTCFSISSVVNTVRQQQQDTTIREHSPVDLSKLRIKLRKLKSKLKFN